MQHALLSLRSPLEKTPHKTRWTKPLRGIRVAPAFQHKEPALLLPSSENSRAKAWSGCLQHIPFRKGAFHDIPSATHDRRHAGAESCTEHANVLRATGVLVRASL